MEVIGHYHNLLNKCHIRPITSINSLLTSDNSLKYYHNLLNKCHIRPITSINFLLTSDNSHFMLNSKEKRESL